MRIAICGASGFIGTCISRDLVSGGHEVVRIGREHFKDSDSLLSSITSCEAIVNLCGAPIVKKWDESYKHELYVSRIETTRKLIKEISKLEKKPSLFISASAVGIYKNDLVHDDDSKLYEASYLALLTKDWETEASKVENLGIRSVIFRLGVVLGRDGGAMSGFRRTFKIGFGVVLGDGNQPFSWIHIDDVVDIFKRAIKNKSMQGIYNLVAPESVTLKTFMKTFGKVLRKPIWFNIPKSIMKIKLAEGAEILLKGSFVIPTKLKKEGYNFKYCNLYMALKSLT